MALLFEHFRDRFSFRTFELMASHFSSSQPRQMTRPRRQKMTRFLLNLEKSLTHAWSSRASHFSSSRPNQVTWPRRPIVFLESEKSLTVTHGCRGLVIFHRLGLSLD
jgi:hypothetical protein